MVKIDHSSKKIFVIAGPTASGKSAAALNLAKDGPSVIINADSMQVYAEIPIISAQPGKEEMQDVPHKLYGIIPANSTFSAGHWLELACQEIDKSHEKNITPIIVGGTGLYLKSLVTGISEIPEVDPKIREQVNHVFTEKGKEKFHEYLTKIDPASAAKIRPSDKQRMLRAAEILLGTGKSLSEWQKNSRIFYPRECFEISLILPERAELYKRCDQRFLQMIEKGALDEVKKIRELRLPASSMALKALGIKELGEYLDGETTLDEAITKAQQATRHYAKRQYTWFRNQVL